MPVRIVKDEPDEIISDNILNNNNSDSSGSSGLGLGALAIGGLIGLGTLAVGAIALFGGSKKKTDTSGSYQQQQTTYEKQKQQTNYQKQQYNTEQTQKTVQNPLINNQQNYNNNQQTEQKKKVDDNMSFEEFKKRNETDNPLNKQTTVTETVVQQTNQVQNTQNYTQQQSPQKVNQLEDVLQRRFNAAKICISMWGYTCGADKQFPETEAAAFKTLITSTTQTLFPQNVANTQEVEKELSAFFFKPVSYSEVLQFCTNNDDFKVKLFEQMCYMAASDKLFHADENKFLQKFSSDVNIAPETVSAIYQKYQLK